MQQRRRNNIEGSQHEAPPDCRERVSVNADSVLQMRGPALERQAMHERAAGERAEFPPADALTCRWALYRRGRTAGGARTPPAAGAPLLGGVIRAPPEAVSSQL